MRHSRTKITEVINHYYRHGCKATRLKYPNVSDSCIYAWARKYGNGAISRPNKPFIVDTTAAAPKTNSDMELFLEFKQFTKMKNALGL